MYGYSGYNLDFEPCQEVVAPPFTPPSVANCQHSPHVCFQVRDCTTEDATAYAAFLNHAAASLHSAPGGPYTLSVDVASWSVFWDWDAIAATDIDRVMVMVTHTTHHMPPRALLPWHCDYCMTVVLPLPFVCAYLCGTCRTHTRRCGTTLWLA